LLEYKSILYGVLIYIYTNHKNLTHGNITHASARVQCYCLILEEFRCICIHIPSKKNILADILSYVSCKTSNEETYYEEFYEDTIQVPFKLQVIEEH